MKQRYLSLLMAFCIFSCYADITEVNDMEEIFKHFNEADSKTLGIFDVDMVLVQPSNPAFQWANMKRFSPICKRVMKEIPADRQMVFLSLMTTSSNPVLIDPRTPEFLKELRDIPLMGLTANLTGKLKTIENMEKWRVDGLRQLGIDFSKSAPSKEPLVFDNLSSYRGHFSTYLDGILFVNGTTISKGEIFLSFLKKIEFYPDKIIFVDDREDNLKSMESALQTLDIPIEFIGLHFTGAQKFPSELISEEEFEAQWKALASETKRIN